jgi:hypothetical protein
MEETRKKNRKIKTALQKAGAFVRKNLVVLDVD